MKITTKARVASVLSICVVTAHAKNHIDIELMLKVIGNAILISLPLILLLLKYKASLNKLMTQGIVILAIPITALVWKWLQSWSPLGEFTFGFIMSFIMTAYSFTASEKELEAQFLKKQVEDNEKP